jgi:hypothetical protein
MFPSSQRCCFDTADIARSQLSLPRGHFYISRRAMRIALANCAAPASSKLEQAFYRRVGLRRKLRPSCEIGDKPHEGTSR